MGSADGAKIAKEVFSAPAGTRPRPRSSIAHVWSLSGLSFGQMASRLGFFAIIGSALIITALCTVIAFKWVGEPFPGFLLNQRMLVANTGLYHWAGVQAGLKFPDKIASANGRVLHSVKDLEEVLQNTSVGEHISYSVIRGKKPLKSRFRPPLPLPSPNTISSTSTST